MHRRGWSLLRVAVTRFLATGAGMEYGAFLVTQGGCRLERRATQPLIPQHDLE